MSKGLFITLEGIDGAGKTTAANLLKQRLEELIDDKKIPYNKVIYTREPGGTENQFCEDIRKLILSNEDLSMKTQILLFAASRNHHCEKTIRPNLLENNIVIVDRFLDSSISYQSVDPKINTRNIDLEKEIKRINLWAIDDFLPDVTFLLDVESPTASCRVNERKQENWIDKNPVEYFETLRNVYLSIAKDNPERVKVIDAYKCPERIVDDIMAFLRDLYGIQ